MTVGPLQSTKMSLVTQICIAVLCALCLAAEVRSQYMPYAKRQKTLLKFGKRDDGSFPYASYGTSYQNLEAPESLPPYPSFPRRSNNGIKYAPYVLMPVPMRKRRSVPENKDTKLDETSEMKREVQELDKRRQKSFSVYGKRRSFSIFGKRGDGEKMNYRQFSDDEMETMAGLVYDWLNREHK